MEHISTKKKGSTKFSSRVCECVVFVRLVRFVLVTLQMGVYDKTGLCCVTPSTAVGAAYLRCHLGQFDGLLRFFVVPVCVAKLLSSEIERKHSSR